MEEEKFYLSVEDDEIIGATQSLSGGNIIDVEVTEEIYNNWKRDKLLYIWNGTKIIPNPNYEADKQAQERERYNSLYMTRSDFFDGMIMAFGLGQSELRAIVEQILNQINITEIQKKVAINNYDNALNFYRKHTLFTLLNNVEISISENITLIFTSDIWDKFFDTNDYHELLKAIKEK